MVIVIASLVIGTLCLFMGYKLLMRGVYSESDTKAVSGDSSLLKRSAPGAVFALFGATMVIVGLVHSTRLRHREAPPAPEQTRTEEIEPLKESAPPPTPRRKPAREDKSRQHTAPQQAPQPGSTTQEREASPADVNPPPQPKVWKPGRA